jgi:ATP-dependent DNA ligase
MAVNFARLPELLGRRIEAAVPRTLSISYQTGMLRPVGFIEPCLPSMARSVPDGPLWVYEIKHDGFRFICWRVGDRCGGCSRVKASTGPAGCR